MERKVTIAVILAPQWLQQKQTQPLSLVHLLPQSAKNGIPIYLSVYIKCMYNNWYKLILENHKFIIFNIYSLPLSLSRQASKSSLLQSKLNLSVGSGNSEQRGSKSSPGSPASLSYRSYNSANTGSDSEGHRQGTGNQIFFYIIIFQFFELYNFSSNGTNFELAFYWIILLGATSVSTTGISTTSGSSSGATGMPAIPIKNPNMRKVCHWILQLD